jgi:hypothetical protein
MQAPATSPLEISQDNLYKSSNQQGLHISTEYGDGIATARAGLGANIVRQILPPFRSLGVILS